MKRLFFLLVMAIMFAMQGLAQTPASLPYSCNFEDADENLLWGTLSSPTTVGWAIGTAAGNGPTTEEATDATSMYVSTDGGTTFAYTSSNTLFTYRDIDFGETEVAATLSYDWKCYGETTYDLMRVFIVDTSTALTSSLSNALATHSGNADWQRNSIELPALIGVKRLVFYFKSDGSVQNTPPAIDNISISVPTCPKPTSFVASNPTTTSINLSWVDENASSWNIQYMLSSETSWDNATTEVATENPYTLSGLTASSTYKVRIQTDCGSEQSEWTNEITFQTACDAVNVPWSQNFDASTALPACCYAVRGAPSIVSSQSNSSPNSLFFTYGVWVTTPSIAEDISLLRVKFFAMAEGSSSGTLEVGLMSDPTDSTTFESVYTIQPSPEDVWIEHEVMFNTATLTGTDLYISFRQNNSTNWYWWVDDVLVDYLPTCVRPTDVTINNLLQTSFDVSFTSDASSFNIQYMLASETDWANATTEVATSSPFNVSELTENTAYKVRMQADCGSGDLSDWTNPITITTPCASIAELPYINNFDSETAGSYSNNYLAPACWRKLSTTNYPYTYNSTTNAHSGANSLYFIFPSTGSDATIVTPSFTEDINSLRIKFWAKSSYTTDRIAIGVMSDLADISTIEFVDTILISSTYTEYEVPFNGIETTGTDKYIVIRGFTTSSYGLMYVDDITVDLLPDCERPTDVTVSNLTSNSFDVSFTSNATSWNIQYMSGTGTDWTNATTENITSTTYSMTELTANTTYQIRIQTDCGGEQSEWTNTITVTTPCESVSIPYLEGFDLASGAFPTCWSKPVVYGNYPQVSTSSTRIHSGTGSLEIRSAASTPSYVVSPPIAEDIETLRVTFWAMAEHITNSGNLEVGIMSNANDITTFESVEIITPTSTDYVQYDVMLNNVSTIGANKFVAFRHTNSNYWYYWIDDVTIDILPTCVKPTDVSASNITTTSADISFVSDATSWNIEYMLDSETDWTNATPDVATSSPHSLTNLLPSSTYKLRIQTNCGSEQSEWTNPITFQTACDAINVPWSQNFDASTVLPACCSAVRGTPSIVSSQSNSSPNSLFFTYGVWVTTPQIAEDVSLLRVKFFARAEGASSGTLEIGLMSDPTDSTTFESVYTIQPSPSSTWIEHEVMFNIATLTGTDLYISFRQNNNTNWYWWVDDVLVDYVPECTRPTDVIVSNITTTTADVSWSDEENSSWNIEYMLASETDWTNATQDVATTNSYALTNLQPSSLYKVRVQADCGSDWTNPITFATACGSITELPYIMNFDSEDNNSIPNCWTRFSSTYPYVYNYTDYVHSGTKSLYYYITSANSNTTIATPPFAEDINLLRVKFWAHSPYGANNVKVAIGVVADVTNTSTIEYVDTVTLTSTYAEYEVPFNATELTGTDNYVVISAFSSTSYVEMFIDDIEVSLIPDCARPTDVIAINPTTTSVDISFVSDATSWNLQYMLADSTSWTNATSVVATINPYTITGLTENTLYKVRMQTDCGDEQSDWTNPITFTTITVPTTLPYSCNFEDADENLLWGKLSNPTTVGWATGTAAGNGPTTEETTDATSMYVSTDGGTTFAYTASNNLYTYRDIDFGETEISAIISYDWKCYGETTYDLMRVFLIDPSTTLTSIPNDDALATHSGDSTWQRNSIERAELTGVRRLVFYFKSDGSIQHTPPAIDNISVSVLTCPTPYEITVSNITTTTADISWGGEATSWNVQYMLASETDWTTATPVVATSNPHTLTALLPSSTYKVRLQANCGDEQSEWSSPITFATACASITDLPYLMNFDNEVADYGSIPNCWTKLSTTYPYTYAYNSHSSPNALYNYVYSNSPNSTIITPPFAEDINLLRVKFWAYSTTANNNMAVGIASDVTDISTIEYVDTLTLTTDYVEYDVPFNATQLTGTDKYIVLTGFMGGSNTYAYIYVDDIEVSLIPDCARPTDVTVSNITTTTADVSWTDEDNSSWNIQYMLASETDWANATPVVATTNPYTLTNLLPASEYKIRVQADCGSDWTNPITFATACQEGAISTYPWEEGFENGITCWGQEFVNGIVSWGINNVNTSGSYTQHSGSFAGMYDNSSADDKTKLISPMLDITGIAAPMLEFYHMQKKWVSDQDQLRVFYRTSETGTWTQLLEFTDTISYWRKDSVLLPEASATYQIAFEGNAKYGYGVAIDDIKIYDAEGLVCVPPTGLQIVTSNTTATLTWSAGGDETSWQVRLGATGSVIDVTTMSHQFTELTPNTNYTAYVRAMCGSSASTWQSIQFTTAQTAPIATTTAATLVSQFTATLNGEYANVASAPESKGFEYKLASAEDWTVVSSTEGETPFYANVTGLEAN
ncbi:MAG: fibronectin type III domain-containing protein, partial [Bacteroidales bacterium]|nr:fibronectin type III domain-containing protein [Bacteroidales bacterium]